MEKVQSNTTRFNYAEREYLYYRENESVSLSTEDYKKYPWLELARKYKNGNQSSDFREIKKSIAMGWAKETGVDGENTGEP